MSRHYHTEAAPVFAHFEGRDFLLRKSRVIGHRPLRRGLVLTPELWPWSSARDYLRDEAGPVLVNEPLRAEMKVREGTRKDPPAA
ncbi:MAG TPA: hypothetical protein VFE08_04530 [Candidatus Sulfotelmatobacter sp.]|nr:hypothetical protein [Candidatus Sulfotelmatobacter sp.]